MQTHPLSKKTILLPLIALIASSIYCNMPPGDTSSSTPTQNVTQAYQTVEARLTQAVAETSALTPSTTPTQGEASAPTPTRNTTISPAPPTSTQPAPTSTKPPAKSCDQAAAGNPIDVTIPDDTVMTPGQTFTKIWRLENVGDCTWTKEYAVTYFSGEQMGALASVPLRGEVLPGQTVDIAVDMVAPTQPGKYQGNWKLRNASNVLFGIGPGSSSPFWVRIVVEASATASVTPTTPAQTLTPTATQPAVHASGTVSLTPGNRVDLDTLGVNSGSGEDLSYESDAEGKHPLVPLDTALIGRYGENRPTLALCQQANLGSTPLVVENIPMGTYLCYRTNQGLTGWARLTGFNVDNYVVTLDLLTWAQP